MLKPHHLCTIALLQKEKNPFAVTNKNEAVTQIFPKIKELPKKVLIYLILILHKIHFCKYTYSFQNQNTA